MNEEITEKLQWRFLSGVEQNRLREARLLAHYALQWLARSARAYIPPQPDDGHTSMEWDHIFPGLRTQQFKNGVWMSLQISNLTLMLHEKNDGAAEGFPLNGQDDLRVRQWLGKQLGDRDLDPKFLDAPSPYDMPAYVIGQGGTYKTAGLEDALGELATWFANADVVLRAVRQQIISNQLSAGPICCWPHHFDLATLATLLIRRAENVGYIGVGLSPGDENYEEPYFYISLSPAPESLPKLSPLGHWHTHEFTAAIVPAHKILATKEQEMATKDFLGDTLTLALQLLT